MSGVGWCQMAKLLCLPGSWPSLTWCLLFSGHSHAIQRTSHFLPLTPMPSHVSLTNVSIFFHPGLCMLKSGHFSFHTKQMSRYTIQSSTHSKAFVLPLCFKVTLCNTPTIHFQLEPTYWTNSSISKAWVLPSCHVVIGGAYMAYVSWGALMQRWWSAWGSGCLLPHAVCLCPQVLPALSLSCTTSNLWWMATGLPDFMTQ